MTNMSLLRKLRPSRNSFILKAAGSAQSGDDGSKKVAKDSTDSLMESQTTNTHWFLTPGLNEVMISSCEAFYEVPYTDPVYCELGQLVVTNFKVCFLPARSDDVAVTPSISKLFGNNDIVIHNIHSIYKVSKSTRRKLITSGSVSRRLRRIEIHCKDLRIHWFNFMKSSQSHAIDTVNKLLSQVFNPPSMTITNNRSVDTVKTKIVVSDDCARFHREADWQRVLQRLKVTSFKVVHCNSRFQLTESLPPCFVVPFSLTSPDAANLSHKFYGNRPPVWSYTHCNKASIVRMSYQLPGLDNDAETKMIEHIKRTHPAAADPVVFDLLTVDLPSTADIHTSYTALRQLCMPPTLKDLWQTDRNWYSLLETTRWLSIVGRCLAVAVDVASEVNDKQHSVILRERESTDLSPLVSCLTQLMLDDYCRTVAGFEELIDREWVALGHRFVDRYQARSSEQCPVFLLFLDCVSQMRLQFPGSFEFTDIYLVRVWDALNTGLFHTFAFNNPHDRSYAADSAMLLPSAWDWSCQYADSQLSLMYDALYAANREVDFLSLKKPSTACSRTVQNGGHSLPHGCAAMVLDNTASAVTGSSTELGSNFMVRRPTAASSAEAACNTVKPGSPSANHDGVKFRMRSEIIQLKLWSLCYLRWLSPVMVVGGGPACEYLTQCLLVEEIGHLRSAISDLETVRDSVDKRRSVLIFGPDFVDSSDRLNVSLNISPMTLSSSFPYVPRHHGVGTPSSLSQIPSIDAYFESSFLSSDLETSTICTDDVNDDDVESVRDASLHAS